MRIKGIVEEDFLNYRLPSMFIISCFCDFKCCKESDMDIRVCQNAPLSQNPVVDVKDSVIFEHFSNNPISKAVVIGGLEPFLQFDEIISLIRLFRSNDEHCTFVIYTGYYPHEIAQKLTELSRYGDIIVKFGRFIPNRDHKYDEILGIELSSDNQFAVRLTGGAV